MAYQWMRCNLSATIFPFVTKLGGRTIVLPQYDQNYEKVLVSAADADKDKGIPQAFYMHNVIPTPQGYKSVGYLEKIEALEGTNPLAFDQALPLQYGLGRFILVPAAGLNYIYDAKVGAWASVSPFPANAVPETVTVTTATINGETYIYYSRYGCYKYNVATKLLEEIILQGLVKTDVIGITAANGYMIAWTEDAIAWSSLTDPEDFTPSLSTGAGGGNVQDARGIIIACLPIAAGFMVYCEQNIVGAKFSGNTRFPYVFKEVPGSAGVDSPEQVSWQGNSDEHYAWTSSGMQKVNTVSCVNLVPELTDFLAMQYFEDFDEDTRTFTEEVLSYPLYVKVTVVSNRFLCVSYGKQYPEYTHILVYDLTLKRWGKLKIQHRDVFAYNFPNLYGELTYDELTMTYDGFGPYTTYDDLAIVIKNPILVKQTLGILQADGKVWTVDFNLDQPNSNGVFMIGKFQFMRNKDITHQMTDIETLMAPDNFQLVTYYTRDGKTLLGPVENVKLYTDINSVRYGSRITGMNLVLACFGSFELTSILLQFTLAGNRRGYTG